MKTGLAPSGKKKKRLPTLREKLGYVSGEEQESPEDADSC